MQRKKEKNQKLVICAVNSEKLKDTTQVDSRASSINLTKQARSISSSRGFFFFQSVQSGDQKWSPPSALDGQDFTKPSNSLKRIDSRIQSSTHHHLTKNFRVSTCYADVALRIPYLFYLLWWRGGNGPKRGPTLMSNHGYTYQNLLYFPNG